MYLSKQPFQDGRWKRRGGALAKGGQAAGTGPNGGRGRKAWAERRRGKSAAQEVVAPLALRDGLVYNIFVTVKSGGKEWRNQ